jgi:ribosomal protein S19E (S16A)
MYIRRVKGPFAITLPDGSQMTRADLPSPTTRRWVASRKAAIVRAVQYGLIEPEEACDAYGLSVEELNAWTQAVSQHGERALKATAVQEFRD